MSDYSNHDPRNSVQQRHNPSDSSPSIAVPNSPLSTSSTSTQTSRSRPYSDYSHNAPPIFGQHNNNDYNTDSYSEYHMNNIERGENEQKFKYHYNLLVYMRSPSQHYKISTDAKISALFISIWCIVNMIGYGMLTINKSEKERIFNNLILFLFTTLMIHKDLILCNGQSCM
eukprot:208062_1